MTHGSIWLLLGKSRFAPASSQCRRTRNTSRLSASSIAPGLTASSEPWTGGKIALPGEMCAGTMIISADLAQLCLHLILLVFVANSRFMGVFGAGKRAMQQRAIYPDLAGKTVFVTGGGSGIGAAITRAFAGQKAKVAFVDIAEEASRALVAEVSDETGMAPLFIPCDIRDIAALQSAIETVRRELGDIAV